MIWRAQLNQNRNDAGFLSQDERCQVLTPDMAEKLKKLVEPIIPDA